MFAFKRSLNVQIAFLSVKNATSGRRTIGRARYAEWKERHSGPASKELLMQPR